MSTQLYSDKRDWNYLWDVGKCPVSLWRYSDSLAIRLNGDLSPSSLLGFLKLLQSPETFMPILEHDTALRKNASSDVKYFSPARDEGEYSLITRDLFSNVVDVAGHFVKGAEDELYKGRKPDDVLKVVDLLKKVESGLHLASGNTGELEDVRDQRKFYEVLIRNQSGFRVS